ncbi:MAG: cytochrome c3 family protein [Planctomycetes bacterium]|nr:cytochrome c3 family protein [Planctomycetota bacterium]
MRHPRTALVVGILSAVAVLLLVVAATGKQSPGRVTSVHGRIAELVGGEACAKCHGGWFGDMRSSCAECHGDVATQIAARRGLHGTLSPELAGACATCHGEHHGDDFPLVNRLAWSQAGVADPAAFDHARVGYTMAGRHLELRCSECHPHADAKLLPEGAKRFLGQSQDCASCHQDPHQGRMQFECATCHEQATFAERRVADHERWLPLVGPHAAVGCRDCHGAGGPHALERLRPGAHAAARGCADCHPSPHSERFLAGNTAAAGVGPAQVCATCHAASLPAFADSRVTVTPAQHAHGGFPLATPHEGVACHRCHQPSAPWAGRHPGRGADDCFACHADPHGGQFAAAAGTTRCLDCHAATHWAPHAFDRDRHARTALPLDGRHAEVGCAACHREVGDASRSFRGTPSRCEQCHQDAHHGAFAGVERQQRLAASPRGTCASCHGTTAFAQLDHSRFDHADWTGFAIDGAHGQIGCEDCHARTGQPDSTGRRFGRVPAHGDGTDACATCHGDPHLGQFDRAGVPATLDGRTGCERCHDTASFRALPHGFDHAAFTGFAMKGAHAQLDCTACHARLAVPTAEGRTWARAKGTACADCHTDPHAGQFERLGATDCNRCHKSTTTFATLSFRHNLDSRFPLGEQHEKVACAGCHKPEQVGGRAVVRYKPLPTECVSCHGREEGGAPQRRRRQ